MIELAPKGTGKSYVFEKISKRGWLISGGTVSRASLIYDNAKKVAKVNTMNCEGKNRRRGMTTGKTAKRKKAIVQLTEDSADIEIFEGL